MLFSSLQGRRLRNSRARRVQRDFDFFTREYDICNLFMCSNEEFCPSVLRLDEVLRGGKKTTVLKYTVYVFFNHEQ